MQDICIVCGTDRNRTMRLPCGEMKVHVMCNCEESKKRERDATEAEFRKKQRIAKLRGESGIGVRFAECSFDNFIPLEGIREALSAAMKFVSTYGERIEGLLFVGATGCGKTHLAVASGNALLGNEVRVVFTRTGSLLSELRATYYDGGSFYEIMRKHKKAKLLILDDFGAEKPSEWVNEQLLELIDFRYANCKPMIITTNLMEKDMRERGIDSRIIDRVLECCRMCPVTAASYRMIKK